MAYTDELNVSSLYSLSPDFVRHETEEFHSHSYEFDDQEEVVSYSLVQGIVHKLEGLIHH